MLAEEHLFDPDRRCRTGRHRRGLRSRRERASVVLLDDNPAPGGQIWRGEEKTPGGSKRDWMVRLSRSGARVYTATRAIAPIGPGLLLAERDCEPLLIHYGKLILATGARELFLPFPG